MDKGVTSLARVAEQTSRMQSTAQEQKWQIGDQLTTPFYLSVGHAYACNRHLRFSTGSQMDCSSLVTCGVFGGNSFSLGKCTQPNFPCSLTAVGMAKITSQGPFHFGNSWSLGEPLFPGFKKNLVPRVYL